MSMHDTKSTDSGSSVFPIAAERMREVADELGIDPGKASIRQMNNLVNALERRFDAKFVRMEFGVPGLPAHPVAIEAEIEALRRGTCHVYAPFEGLPALKEEGSRFVKNFMGLDLPPECCVPTVGAMQGCFSSLMLAGRLNRARRTVLLLEPGFPVNLLQLRMLGLQATMLDFYHLRGDRLIDAVEERVARGDICAILWSSPNNPSWIVLRESELKGLGRICERHDVLAIEDLAYFGMDTRHDYLEPGRPPYQPTTMRYTDRAVCIVSSSKMFSYAGQRIALALLPASLMEREAPDLAEFFGTARVGQALMHGVLYPTTACVPQTPQHGLVALLRAANAGDRSVFSSVAEYARRSRRMKPMFLDNGFRLVYDNDLGEPLADGFYFTVAHPDYDDGADLLRELLRYGVSAITLETTGSCRREGLRACVSMAGDEQLAALETRLARFRDDHG
jgi:aspartate/methionine/tyrosine aminotransferase